MNTKDITKLISTWKPKCDMQNGMYNNIDNLETHTVFTFKPNMETFFNIVNSDSKMKWIEENGYTIDPTWDNKTSSIIFRIKRVFHVDARVHFNKSLCAILNVDSIESYPMDEKQIEHMESMFSIYNKQFKVAFAQKQKSLCETNLGGKKISTKLDGQIKRMMEKTNMTFDECLSIIG